MRPLATLAAVPWAALVPIFLVALAFEVYCLVELVRSEPQYLPKWAWALVILLTIPLGGILFLTAGRKVG